MAFKGIVSIKIGFSVTPHVPKKLYIVKTVVTLPSSHAAADLEGWNNRTAEMEEKQVSNATFKCTGKVFVSFFDLIFGQESVMWILPY